MFDNTITLFNYHKKSDSWYTSVFTKADLVGTDSTKATQQGQTNGAAVDLLINVRADKTADTIAGTADTHIEKQYLPPKAYAALPVPGNHFTFTPESDFFIIGNHYSQTPIVDSAYIEGLYSEMNAEYDGVFMICSAAYYSLIPHFEIGGR